MSQQTRDDYAIGLLLALVFFAAIPLTSGAALWLSVLLLVLVWGPIIFGSKWVSNQTVHPLAGILVSGEPTPGVNRTS